MAWLNLLSAEESVGRSELAVERGNELRVEERLEYEVLDFNLSLDMLILLGEIGCEIGASCFADFESSETTSDGHSGCWNRH